MLHPKLTIKLSFRLSPNSDVNEIADFIVDELEKDPPYNSDIKVTIESKGEGFCMKPLNEEFYKIINDSSE